MKFHFSAFPLLLLTSLCATNVPNPAADAVHSLLFRRAKKAPQHRLPYQVLLVLPARESEHDKYRLTLDKARPVIDISVDDVVTAGILPPGWIELTDYDSRFWEDSLVAEMWASTGVVNAYCEGRLDAVFGFADAYALATVAKISAGFREGGVPVMTTTGLTSTLGSRKSYPYLTRMLGSYRMMSQCMYEVLAVKMKYKNMMFMYHDRRRAINKIKQEQSMGENPEEVTPSSQCYFSLYSIKTYFTEKDEYFKDAWKVQTPHLAFDEELNFTRHDLETWLKMASFDSNDVN